MQDRATCSGLPGVCVDKMRLMFPNVGECERCSSMKNPMNANCMDRSGLGNEMMVEFTANRETDLPGFEILANCVEPGFNQNNIPAPGGIGKRHAEQCSSPEGSGPRDLPALPPPVSASLLLQRYYYRLAPPLSVTPQSTATNSIQIQRSFFSALTKIRNRVFWHLHFTG